MSDGRRSGAHGVRRDDASELLRRDGVGEGRRRPRRADVERDRGDPAERPIPESVVAREEGPGRRPVREQARRRGARRGRVLDARRDESPVDARPPPRDAARDRRQEPDVGGRHDPALGLVPLDVVQRLVQEVPPPVDLEGAGRRGRVEDVHGRGLLDERQAGGIPPDGLVEGPQGVGAVG